MTRIGILLIILLSLVSSCKSSKVSGTNIANLSAKKVIKKHYAAGLDKESLKANLTIKYKGKANLPNMNASIRIDKDSIIWISISKFGIPLAKVMITRNRVQFYEKLSKTYFIGGFDLISHWLGVALDFDQIQNLFYADALINLNKEKYQVQIQENLYVLNQKNDDLPVEFFFWIDPQTFKLNKEEISNTKKNQILTVSYKDFNKINESLFPKGFVIHAIDKKNKTIIDLNYRNVTFNTSLRFPFKIPNGYREIELNDLK